MNEPANAPKQLLSTTRKSLSERIAARILKTPGASIAARNRSVFILLREDIQQALIDGWSLLAIWQALHDEQRVAFTYQAFRRYARSLISPPVQSEHLSKIQPFAFNSISPKEPLQ